MVLSIIITMACFPEEGAAGMLHQPQGYLTAGRELCDQHGTLLKLQMGGVARELVDKISPEILRTSRYPKCLIFRY